jgi:hypothetical protein
MSMAALPRPRQVFEKVIAVAAGFGKNHRDSGSIFFRGH